MLTPTHSLLAVAVLARKGTSGRNRAILAGSLIPDAFIYVAWVVYMLMGKTQSEIWDVLYFQNPTQFFDALFNSIPVYVTLALISWFLLRSKKRKSSATIILVFSLAALIHIASDIPVHASDAHRHFWPISDWRFYSPLSYWEGDHHAAEVSMGEGLLGIALCAILWKRFPVRWVRVLLGVLAIGYALLFAGTLLYMTGVLGNFP